MKNVTCLLFCLLAISVSCKKIKSQDNGDEDKNNPQKCDIIKTQTQNSSKVTIATGVWGTVSVKQGNCMPMISPTNSTCTQCAIQREVRIYTYTKSGNATPAVPLNGLYDSFTTQLIKTVAADDQGFFEASLPDGKYTVVFVENGKLYANIGDGAGGLSPLEIAQNKVKLNLVMDKAVY